MKNFSFVELTQFFHGPENFVFSIVSSIMVFVLAQLVSLFFVVKRKPVWFHDDSVPNIGVVREQWGAFVWKTVLFSFGVAVLTFFVAVSSSLTNFALFFVFNVTLVSFVAFFSILTDVSLRLVDRFILRIVFVLTLVSSVVFSSVFYVDFAAVYPHFFLLLTIFLVTFLSFGLGASDGRAILVTYAAVGFFLPTFGVTLSWLSSVVVSIGYALKHNGWRVKNLFNTKISLPLVPIILIPNVFVVAAAPLFLRVLL